jgi:hypothetical protein
MEVRLEQAYAFGNIATNRSTWPLEAVHFAKRGTAAMQ